MTTTDEKQGGNPTLREGVAEDFEATRAEAARRTHARDAMLALVIVAGLVSAFFLTRWLDAHRPAEDPFATYEELYIKPETARRMSLGFNGLVADWYWLRSLQYVGRKVGAFKGDIVLDDMSPLGIKNLGPLLDEATTLDPQFMAAYEFGAIVLPSIDRDAAVRLVEKGIAAKPLEWRLYHHLGYIHWQAGRYLEARVAYTAGSRLPGAPAWMSAMAAQMEAHGGSRELAREMYRRMQDESGDEQIKVLAQKRLAQLDSLDERDLIRRALADFQTRASRCPASWREVAPSLRNARLKVDAAGSPLDPAGFPYALDVGACDVKLDERSPIPKK
jgi:hypothetical protein